MEEYFLFKRGERNCTKLLVFRAYGPLSDYVSAFSIRILGAEFYTFVVIKFNCQGKKVKIYFPEICSLL